MVFEEHNDYATVLNNIIEKHVGLPVEAIRHMTPGDRALRILESNGYGTTITTTNTRGIDGRGSILAALGKTTSASEARRRFAKPLN